MKKAAAPSLRYMSGLDGLRAIAVMLVILYHLNTGWAPGGLLGVGIFFVLSGYLITDILISGWKKTGSLDLATFWIRRFRRLLPGMLTVLLAVLVWCKLANLSLPTLQGDALASLFYVNNWWLIFHKVSYFDSFGMPSPLGHFWSLAVEEQFYLLWPLVLLAALKLFPKRGRLLGVTLTGAVLSALLMKLLFVPGTDPSRVYYGTDTRAFGMLIGASLAMVWPSARLSANAIKPLGRLVLDGIGALSLAAILYLAWNTNQYSESLYPGGLLLLSLLSAVLIAVLAHPASLLGRVIGSSPLRWLGKRSYGIYLWHYPVIVLTTPVVNTEGPSVLRAVVQTAVTLLLAALSYAYIEDPIRQGGFGRIVRCLTQEASRKVVLKRTAYLSLGFILLFGGVHQLFPNAMASGSAPLTPGQGTSAGTGNGKGTGNLPSPSVVPSITEPASPSPSATPASSSHPSATPNHSAAGNGMEEGAGASTSNPVKPTPTPTPSEPTPTPTADSTATVPPSVSPSPTAAPTPGHTKKPDSKTEVVAIGDSVLLDAEPYLMELISGLTVDGKVGRQMWDAQEIVNGRIESGTIGNRVILNLGTNGAFTKKQLGNLLESLKGLDQVILVNVRVPRPWESNVNEMLANVARGYDNATVIDWHSASAGHDEYFAKDGVHLNTVGSKAYAKLVASHMQ